MANVLETYLVMVANKHEHGDLPAVHGTQHCIQRLDGQASPQVPEVACSTAAIGMAQTKC